MINIAYNDFLVYGVNGEKLYPNSNIIEYDVHPWHTLTLEKINKIKEEFNIEFPYKLTYKESPELLGTLHRLNCHDFVGLLDNNRNTFNMFTLDEAYEQNINFIYPIVLYNNDIFLKYETIDLPEKLIESVKNKVAKICFYQATEGFYGQRPDDIIWVENLSKRYGFSKNDIIVITSNMISDDFKKSMINNGIIEDNFTIFPYNYFQHNLWFTNCRVLDEHCVQEMRNKFNECLLSNKNFQKTKHFLCFNRISKLHRIVIFAELMTNESLIDKSIVSLGSSQNEFTTHFSAMVYQGLSDSYKHDKKRLLKFYENYDSTKSYVYDCDDPHRNKASDLNIEAHSSTFLNIITESLIDTASVFYSEKTFKPMACAQPFIMYGNPFSLKKLKEYGFKTFDKWWDESYDNELDFAVRTEKIIDVLKEIASWDFEKCYQVTQEMEEILIHNFNLMVSDVEVLKLYNLLSDYENKKLNKLL